MMNRRFGVVSSGRLSQGSNGSRSFRAGDVVELGQAEVDLFLGQAPDNFVELIDGVEWNEHLASRFLPGGDLFRLSREERLDFMAKMVSAGGSTAAGLPAASSSESKSGRFKGFRNKRE